MFCFVFCFFVFIPRFSTLGNVPVFVKGRNAFLDLTSTANLRSEDIMKPGSGNILVTTFMKSYGRSGANFIRSVNGVDIVYLQSNLALIKDQVHDVVSRTFFLEIACEPGPVVRN